MQLSVVSHSSELQEPSKRQLRKRREQSSSSSQPMRSQGQDEQMQLVRAQSGSMIAISVSHIRVASGVPFVQPTIVGIG